MLEAPWVRKLSPPWGIRFTSDGPRWRSTSGADATRRPRDSTAEAHAGVDGRGGQLGWRGERTKKELDAQSQTTPSRENGKLPAQRAFVHTYIPHFAHFVIIESDGEGACRVPLISLTSICFFLKSLAVTPRQLGRQLLTSYFQVTLSRSVAFNMHVHCIKKKMMLTFVYFVQSV